MKRRLHFGGRGLLIRHKHDDIVEKIPPNLPLQRAAISPSLAKRGEGRFYDICILTYDLVNTMKNF
jgi:hypothetical protein